MDILAQQIAFQILLVLFLSVIFFSISFKFKKNSVADIFWGLTFVILATCTFSSQAEYTFSGGVVLALIWIWGIRLSYYILKRSLGKKEDLRYEELSKSWGKYFYIRSYLQVFLLQGVLAFLVLSPATSIFVFRSTRPGSTLLLGLIVWVVGFIFESVGDWQLNKFIRNPQNKGKIMTLGLWKYTRHPNYFGEAVMWWGIFIISIPFGLWWYSVLGPLLITFLLTRVSGIPMTEKHFEGRLGWDEYKYKTSSFFPWFPKKELKK